MERRVEMTTGGGFAIIPTPGQRPSDPVRPRSTVPLPAYSADNQRVKRFSAAPAGAAQVDEEALARQITREALIGAGEVRLIDVERRSAPAPR